MEEGETPVRTIPTSNFDPDYQEQGGLGVWCVASGQKWSRDLSLSRARSRARALPATS
jgi:hypothetical protein